MPFYHVTVKQKKKKGRSFVIILCLSWKVGEMYFKSFYIVFLLISVFWFFLYWWFTDI